MDENNFGFELEERIKKTCKTFSLKNTKQDQNLIETLLNI